MTPLYRAFHRSSPPGRRLIDLTMLKTLPARPTAASYSSFSSPVASSTSVRRTRGVRRPLAPGPGEGGRGAGPRRAGMRSCLAPEVDREGDQAACRDAREDVLAGLAGAGEDHQ